MSCTPILILIVKQKKKHNQIAFKRSFCKNIISNPIEWFYGWCYMLLGQIRIEQKIWILFCFTLSNLLWCNELLESRYWKYWKAVSKLDFMSLEMHALQILFWSIIEFQYAFHECILYLINIVNHNVNPLQLYGELGWKHDF